MEKKEIRLNKPSEKVAKQVCIWNYPCLGEQKPGQSLLSYYGFG
jgi:hypothetical protein